MLSALATARRRLHTQPADAGITLTEFLVSMGIMSMVGALAMTFFVNASQATDKITDESLITGQARVAMSAVIEALQLADSPSSPGAPDNRFQTIQAGQVVFYSDDNANRAGDGTRTAPNKVSFSTANGQLTETIYHPKSATPSDWTTNYPTNPSSTRILVDRLGPGSGFGYCSDQVNANGTCVTTGSTTAVAAVVVTFAISGQPGDNAQTLTSAAAITGDFQ